MARVFMIKRQTEIIWQVKGMKMKGQKPDAKWKTTSDVFVLESSLHFYQLTIVHDDKTVTMGAYTIR